MIAMTIHLNFAWNSNAVFCRWPVCFGGSLSMLFKNSHAGDRILLHEQLLFISCLKIACSKIQHPYHEYMRIIMCMAYACIPCCFTVKHLLTTQDPIFNRWQVFGASNTIKRQQRQQQQICAPSLRGCRIISYHISTLLLYKAEHQIQQITSSLLLCNVK